MTQFLHPTPASITYQWDTPRDTHISNSGVQTTTARQGGVWRGSAGFAPSGPGDANQLLSLVRADVPNVGFFIDLPAGGALPTGTAAAPVWQDVGGGTNTNRLHLPTNHTVVKGDLVSFRQSLLPDYVTARVVHDLITDALGRIMGLLDVELPQEFFVLSSGSQMQYCLNRPHVRAVFTDPPVRMRKRNAKYIEPFSVDWHEDTGGTALALRSISQVDGTQADALLDRQGQPLLDRNNALLQDRG